MERMDIIIDEESRIVRSPTESIQLTRTEFTIFSLLYKKYGQLVSREELLYAIDGYQGDVQTRTIDVHIASLRKKIGRLAPVIFEGVYGKGYRFSLKD